MPPPFFVTACRISWWAASGSLQRWRAWRPTSAMAVTVVAAVTAAGLGCGGGDVPAGPLDASESGDHLPRSDTAGDAALVDVSDGSPPQDAAGGYTLASFPGGFDFPLTLPPRFAPFLPLYGDEATREMPGFHDPTSPNYFSYGFLWWLTGAPDLSTNGLRDHLALYYTGLCALTTAATVTLAEPEPPRDVSGDGGAAGLGTLVARRAGTLRVGSCKDFDAPIPDSSLEISTHACPDHVAVLVLISPHPLAAGGAVWSELHRVRDTFTCW